MKLYTFFSTICLYTVICSCGNNTKQNDSRLTVDGLKKTFWKDIQEGRLSEKEIQRFIRNYDNITEEDIRLGADGSLYIVDKDIYSDSEILAPYKLCKGDTICILEPSRTNADMREKFELNIDQIKKAIEDRGFNVLVLEDSFKVTDGDVFETTAQQRADCFNQAVKNKDVKAIFCFCGGYGAIQILDKLDYEAIRQNRKIFVGFSDETSVQLAMLKKSGLMSFYGPMFGAKINFNQRKCFDELFKMLTTPSNDYNLRNIDDETPFIRYDKTGKNCEARIVGGCLFLNQCSLGTPYMPDFENKIFFFEDDSSAPFRVHRALEQLKLAGKLDNLAGVIIGALTTQGSGDDIPQKRDERLNICLDVLDKKCKNIPIVYGVHVGCVRNPTTIPIGAKAKIEGNKIIITEPVVC